MSEDKCLTARPGTMPVPPHACAVADASARTRDPERAPRPGSRLGHLYHDGSHAVIVTAVRNALERKADFGS